MKKLWLLLLVSIPVLAVAQNSGAFVMPLKPRHQFTPPRNTDSTLAMLKRLRNQDPTQQLLLNQGLIPVAQGERGNIYISPRDGMAVIAPDKSKNAPMPVLRSKSLDVMPVDSAGWRK